MPRYLASTTSRTEPQCKTPDVAIPDEIVGQWTRRFEILARRRLSGSIKRLADEIAEWVPETPDLDDSVLCLGECGLLTPSMAAALEKDFPTVGDLVNGDYSHIYRLESRRLIRAAIEKVTAQLASRP